MFKSVQLVRGSSFRNNLLQKPYFNNIFSSDKKAMKLNNIGIYTEYINVFVDIFCIKNLYTNQLILYVQL